MANSKSATKRALQNEKIRLRNRGHRSNMRTEVKRLRAAIEAGDAETAKSLLPTATKIIDSTATKNVIHRNTASRTISRLTRAVNALDS